MVQCADDSTLTASGKTVQEISEKLEQSCEAVRVWMRKNKQKLNPEKNHIMLLGTDQRLSLSSENLQIMMDGVALSSSEVGNELLLGCWFQSNLRWGKHARELSNKLRSRLVF